MYLERHIERFFFPREFDYIRLVFYICLRNSYVYCSLVCLLPYTISAAAKQKMV